MLYYCASFFYRFFVYLPEMDLLPVYRLPMAEMPKNLGGGDVRSEHRVFEKPGETPTLAEQGIDKNLAHRAWMASQNPDDRDGANSPPPQPERDSTKGGDSEIERGDAS